MTLFLTYPLQGTDGEFARLVSALRSELRKSGQAVAPCCLTACPGHEDCVGDLNPAKTSDMMLVVAPSLDDRPLVTERMQMEIDARKEQGKPILVIPVDGDYDSMEHLIKEILEIVLSQYKESE